MRIADPMTFVDKPSAEFAWFSGRALTFGSFEEG